jgi:Type II secretory pathway, pullulanase PulA and related glycosidases
MRGGLEGAVTHGPEIYDYNWHGNAPGFPHTPSSLDSATHMARSVVVDSAFSAYSSRPRHPWDTTVVYEAHVRGLTKRLPGMPDRLRGTYAGLAHPFTISHLQRLGVTALELLPIHAKMAEPALTMRGRSNYWGYNTLAFFAPEPSYATEEAQAGGAQAVLDEFKGMVHLLHEAGIEVILDVVYNHTAEGGIGGPTLSPAWPRQSHLLPPRRGQQLPGLHRLWQHGRLPPHPRRPADAGLPPLLGGGRGRGRLPLRPRGDARAPPGALHALPRVPGRPHH